MILVHVIPPSGLGGDRHEERFQDGTPDAEIIENLTQLRENLGQSMPPLQDGYGRLKGGLSYLSHPQTVVAIGIGVDGEFIEERRLRGPAS